MKCLSCRTENPSEYWYCAKCGNNLLQNALVQSEGIPVIEKIKEQKNKSSIFNIIVILVLLIASIGTGIYFLGNRDSQNELDRITAENRDLRDRLDEVENLISPIEATDSESAFNPSFDNSASDIVFDDFDIVPPAVTTQPNTPNHHSMHEILSSDKISGAGYEMPIARGWKLIDVF
ncbi:MAG: hypothetical protein LBD23_15450 [Oscillospiraceae bacterium]|jgi:uncharacterized membrane protein YvbJ|nr:hypothetical protein [Oscillospiraceae bacterium]